MSKLDDIQMFYKVKAGKDLYLDAPGPEDRRVWDEDEKDLERRMKLKKGSRGPVPWDDPYAIATAAIIADKSNNCSGGDPSGPPWGDGDFARGSDCSQLRDALAQEVAANLKGGKKKGGRESGKQFSTASMPLAAMQKAVADLTFDQNIRRILKKGCGCTEDLDIEKISTSLASLMSAAAGWALSGDVTRDKDDHLKREWDLHHKERMERERREEEKREARRRGMKKSHDFLVSEDFLAKDHMSIPPRQGLLWDAVKHRWTRPENVGRTVSEVQGSKRFRAHGTGAHERKVGGHGSGAVRGAQSGRKFRATTDVGRLRPHETSHPAHQGLKGGKDIRRKGHKKTYLKVLREHRNKQKRRKHDNKKDS